MKKNVVIAKRKTVIASGYITPGLGKISVNSKSLDAFGDKLFKLIVTEPMVLAGEAGNKYNIVVTVHGGGRNARAYAVRAVVAKALAHKEHGLRKTFLEYDRTLLVDDKRQTEPQKPYRSAARALKQTSYR